MKIVVLSATPWGSVFIKENMSVVETIESAGVGIYTGKLNGKPITLIEQQDGGADPEENLLADLDAKYIVSLGEAYSSKKNPETGDMVVSSGSACLEAAQPNSLREIDVDRKLVDLSLKAAEKFNSDEKICKVVVGKILIDPGTSKTGLKLNFLPQDDIYCMDNGGYPFTQWVVNGNIPFVLIRTVVPIMEQYGRLEVTQFRWDTAKKNFWIVKGIIDGLKQGRVKRTSEKVDLI